MSNDKIVLATGMAITLAWSQGISALHVDAATKAEACELWEEFTPVALKEVSVKNAEGLTVGRYQDMVLDHVTASEKADGTVDVTFCLRSKTTDEVVMEQLAALKIGQGTQDEAISDLGQAVSDLAEGGV